MGVKLPVLHESLDTVNNAVSDYFASHIATLARQRKQCIADTRDRILTDGVALSD